MTRGETETKTKIMKQKTKKKEKRFFKKKDTEVSKKKWNFERKRMNEKPPLLCRTESFSTFCLNK